MRLPHIGQKFRDRYLVEEVLGEGAFGAVYAATDTAASRPVALKILKPDAGETYDPKTKARFDREIQVVANLMSPNTVSLFDCGETADGLLFSVFERVPGEDLSEHLRRVGRMPAGPTVHVVRQVLMSLQEAHGKGLLHRDIKPQNIRVFQHQNDPLTVKVLDFGLARNVAQEGPTVTEQGEVIGTPRYMAPEQLMDAPVTPASDVYSLGVVMLQMLMGVDTLHGTKFGDQLNRLRAGHEFSTEGLEHSGLEPIIKRMTARDPEQRFVDATAVLRALDQWQAGFQQPPSGPFQRPAPSTSSGTFTRPATTSSGITQQPTRPLSGSSVGPATSGSNNNTLIAGAALLVLLILGLGYVLKTRLEEADTPPAPPPQERPTGGLIATTDPPPQPEPKPVEVETVDAGRDTNEPFVDVGPPAACGQEPSFVGKGNLGLSHHTWLTYVPRDYDPNRQYPLVILLHPTGQTPDELLRYSRFDRLAEEHDFIVIAPSRNLMLPISWVLGPEDPEFIRGIVLSTQDQLCVDKGRVFIASQGFGGYPSYVLACSDWVTGIATNAFRMDASMQLCSGPSRPYMLMSPDDGHDPWEGGQRCAGAPIKSVEDVEKLWAEKNGCSSQREQTFRHKGSKCFTYDACETPFVSCHIKGGHNWPGSPKRGTDMVNCDGVSPDFPMAERMWSFFESLEPLPP